MANLTVNGASWGSVFKSEAKDEYPCMDNNYRELTWTFDFHKEFTDFAAMMSFEKNTRPTYFSNREKNVEYAGRLENDMILISLERAEILTPRLQCHASYKAIFTKSG